MFLLQPLLELVTDDCQVAKFCLQPGELSSVEAKEQQHEHNRNRNAALYDFGAAPFPTMLTFGAARICHRERHDKL